MAYGLFAGRPFMTYKFRVIICGAGITGVSAAYYLASAGIQDILLLDERPPLTLTSDRSTECYRNWWPDGEMLELMNRSIDLMDDLADASHNTFHMNRRGYLYVTADAGKVEGFKESAAAMSRLGGGPLRIHDSVSASYSPRPPTSLQSPPEGADLLLGNALIRKHFPYLTDKALAALHARRAGWLSAQQLGMYLLERARSMGLGFRLARVESVQVTNGRVRAVTLGNGEQLECSTFVNAAGPYLKHVGALCGVEIPVKTELHLKVAFRDHLGVVGREAPLLIWDDMQYLPWDEEERLMLGSDPDTSWLTEAFQGGAHTRPEGTSESTSILMLWDYKSQVMEPVFPPPLDERYPEVALRGLATMLPGLQAYFGRAPRPQIDGGYYVRTRENRPLIGPTRVEGVYVIGGVSGYGIMSACAAGELVAAHIAGKTLPSYAPALSLARYDDREYVNRLEHWEQRGEL